MSIVEQRSRSNIQRGPEGPEPRIERFPRMIEKRPPRMRDLTPAEREAKLRDLQARLERQAQQRARELEMSKMKLVPQSPKYRLGQRRPPPRRTGPWALVQRPGPPLTVADVVEPKAPASIRQRRAQLEAAKAERQRQIEAATTRERQEREQKRRAIVDFDLDDIIEAQEGFLTQPQ